MDRRKFIRNGSLTGIGFAAVGSLSRTVAGTVDSPSKQKSSALNLEEITVQELQKKMQSGEESSVSITRAYLERIKEIDKAGPMLNAVIELNPDSVRIAEGLDLERKNGKIRGPLHGIPVLVKDNINTGDQMLTTAGSIALDGNHAKEDAFVIKQLRDAGVVLLGKT
ncbi:MAG TPA: amidase family protein, partial [Puia sp.]|nr:amidase family protein [Puia sp.]